MAYGRQVDHQAALDDIVAKRTEGHAREEAEQVFGRHVQVAQIVTGIPEAWELVVAEYRDAVGRFVLFEHYASASIL